MVLISALRKLGALFLSRGVASLSKHSALVLSLLRGATQHSMEP